MLYLETLLKTTGICYARLSKGTQQSEGVETWGQKSLFMPGDLESIQTRLGDGGIGVLTMCPALCFIAFHALSHLVLTKVLPPM